MKIRRSIYRQIRGEFFLFTFVDSTASRVKIYDAAKAMAEDPECVLGLNDLVILTGMIFQPIEEVTIVFGKQNGPKK